MEAGHDRYMVAAGKPWRRGQKVDIWTPGANGLQVPQVPKAGGVAMIFEPIDNSGGNVTMLPVAAKPRPDAELEVVHSYKCQHGHFLVDEKKDRVECGLCHEMLSPIWVLIQIARDDSRLRDRWSHMKAEVMLLEPKLRTKCQHCQKMTPIPSNARTEHIRNLAAKIRQGDA